MAKLQIRKVGDEVLRRTCRPIEAITPRVLTLLDDMIDTMRAANGVGLAGPQVGILRRIAVVEVEEGEVYELINPKIVAIAGEQEGAEGCLSVPGRYGLVKRPRHVTVRATNRLGEEYEINAHDFLARALCHEIDHLDGTLYIDKVTRMLSEEEIG
ncbi:MAG: peptide deformylase [Clostridia bacterium]|nr:peptide deformylase [Clostridia bacterium]